MSHTGKIFCKILEKRLRTTLEPQLSETQLGFRKNKGCTDAIFALRQLIEKSIEFNETLYLAFVDQEKAFDRVDRNKLWEILKQYGVSTHLTNLCRSLYNNSECIVRATGEHSEPFTIRSGVRQGCVLSPLLFITYIDNICKETSQAETARIPHDENTEEEPSANLTIRELLFADDQALIAKSEAELQDHMNSLNEMCREHNMKISTSKTEVMTITKEEQTATIHLNEHPLKQVKSFKYLGSIISSNGRSEDEIENRCNKANQLIGQMAPILKNKHVSITTKKALYNTIFLPTLCYQCQTWTMTEKEKRKITTTEMRFLRRILNVSRRDKIRNEEIRTKVGVKAALDFIRKQQVKWFGHASRLPVNSMPQQAMMYRPDGNRGRGRPRKRWTEGITESMGMSIYEAHNRALSRSLYFTSTPQGTRGT